MEAIEPPVPEDTDLQDFEFMPLYVRALTRSEFAAVSTDAEFRAGVMLWCECWHQVPAGSVPDDDRVLAMLAGLGRGDHAVEAWLKVKAGAMRNFVMGTDGRWWHPRIASEAADAWQRKQEMAANRSDHAAKMRELRQRKKAKNQWDAPAYRGDNSTDEARDNHASPTSDNHVIDACPSRDDHVSSLTETETETETKKKDIPQPAAEALPPGPVRKRKRKLDEAVTYPADFEAWWAIYPRKVGKLEALRCFDAAKKIIGPGADEKLTAAAMAYRKKMTGEPEEFVAHPTTWLNQGRWDDELEPSPGGVLPHMVGRNRFGVGG